MGEFWGGKRYVIFKICVIFEKGSLMFKTKKIRGSPMRWVSNEKGVSDSTQNNCDFLPESKFCLHCNESPWKNIMVAPIINYRVTHKGLDCKDDPKL